MAPCPLQALVNAAIAALVCAATGSTFAQWTAISLHSPQMLFSYGYGGHGPSQGGTGAFTSRRPILWNATNGSWSDLTPQGFSGGDMHAVFARGQGGQVGGHAALWHGAASTFVDLHPANDPAFSVVLAVDAQQQVGYIQPSLADGRTFAALWQGSAVSHVSLHADGAYDSAGHAVFDGQQGGFYRTSSSSGAHAALWWGTPQTMVDLHPTGAVESKILGMGPGQQVGWARAPVTHAALWNSTAASYIDMSPAGAGFSQINSSCGSAQAGSANFGAGARAGVWFGAPGSFVSLAPFTPAGYGQTIATSISSFKGRYYVGGYARNLATNSDEAFVWISDAGLEKSGDATQAPAPSVDPIQR